jgi:hypothetical protein
MSFGDGDVKFRRRLSRIVRGVFDDETFLAFPCSWVGRIGGLGAGAGGEDLEAEITSDPVLEMDNIIAVVEVSEIDIEGGASSLCVW